MEENYDPSFDMAGFVNVYNAYVSAVANTFNPNVEDALLAATELEARAARAKAYWKRRRGDQDKG